MPSVSDRVKCPDTGRTGKVVFISPINKKIYVEYGREFPFVAYPPYVFASHNDLFGPL